MKTRFQLRKPSSEKPTPINLVLHWKNSRLVLSTQEMTLPAIWDQVGQRIKGNSPKVTEKNLTLTNLKNRVENEFRQYTNDIHAIPTKEQFRGHWLKVNSTEAIQEKVTLVSFIRKLATEHDMRRKNEGKPLGNQSAGNSFRQTANVLEDYSNQTTVDFNSIDQSFHTSFVAFCRFKKNFAISNTGKHIKNIKTAMNEAVYRGLTTSIQHRHKNFKVLTERKEAVYLNKQELGRIRDVKFPSGSRLDQARDLFLIGCWTGLRVSDFSRIELKHIMDGEFIKIDVKKTGNEVEIPLLPTVLQCLQKYNYRLPVINDQHLNKLVKEVCENAGIDQSVTIGGKHAPKCDFVTTHTARRSFATNAFKDQIPAGLIMKITGHKTEAAFLRYIHMENREFAQLFKKLWSEEDSDQNRLESLSA